MAGVSTATVTTPHPPTINTTTTTAPPVIAASPNRRASPPVPIPPTVMRPSAIRRGPFREDPRRRSSNLRGIMMAMVGGRVQIHTHDAGGHGHDGIHDKVIPATTTVASAAAAAAVARGAATADHDRVVKGTGPSWNQITPAAPTPAVVVTETIVAGVMGQRASDATRVPPASPQCRARRGTADTGAAQQRRLCTEAFARHRHRPETILFEARHTTGAREMAAGQHRNQRWHHCHWRHYHRRRFSMTLSDCEVQNGRHSCRSSPLCRLPVQHLQL
jgi:hypothetical protein